MALSKEILLTVKDYTVILTPNKPLLLYVNDCLDLIFTINQLGVKNANSSNTLTLKEFPLDGLQAQLFVENANQSDYVEATDITGNNITFRLTSKYTQYIGKGKMQIRLYDDDGCELKLPSFEYEIKATINEEFNGNIPEPPVVLQSISATYTQGSTVIYPSTSLNELKSSLVVTGTYSDESTQPITDYVLSGTLNIGESTVTVTYKGKTATFKVTVTEQPTEKMYYGRLSIAEVGGRVIQYNEITEDMIKTGANITVSEPQTLNKVSMGLTSETAEGDYVVVAVPSSRNYAVTQDNGFGGKTVFDEETAGANGIDLSIDGIAYKLYGNILLSQGEVFIYVD